MSIATRKGDGGTTDLLFGRRVSKTHDAVVAAGAVDELNAALGIVRVETSRPGTRVLLGTIQGHLVNLMGEVAVHPEDSARYQESAIPKFDPEALGKIDEEVERIEEREGLTFEGWAMPGAAGSRAGAALDLARTVARRAERAVLTLAEGDGSPRSPIVRYLNRLSDLLWLLARLEEKVEPAAHMNRPG